jgi:Ni/Co efflux regulator RcnB
MNLKKIVSAILAISLSSAGFAQSFGDQPGRGRNDQGQRSGQQDRRDNNQGQRQQGSPNYQGRPDNQGSPNYQGRPDNMGQNRGAGPNHDFRKGGRLPPQYRSRQYVVNDWRGHNLSAPPRGYHWVQTGGDYVLAAIATGVIMQLFLNN